MIFLILLLTLTMMSPSTLAARKAKRQNDFWGSWGEWGECSRSCGGGISLRQRPCYSRRTDGGSSCIGPAQSYRSCNIQDCPEGSRDFRGEQCAEFDGTEFQGKKYKWLPYYGAPNKCELNCIPKGENFYYKQKEAVTDGTPCEPGKNDVCVQGTCRAVGCDKMLDSSQKEDKCLQCGGNGRACFEVKGLFDVPNLPKGYNQIFVIPMGATSIRIKEATPTRNFLAIKNVQGTYYLNGHWTIEYSQALPIASTVVHYDRGSEGDLAPELLHARGPITEPLIIELISQEQNQGVHYEYYLPFQRQTSSYNWGYGSWSDCSTECGGGYQSRLVFCTIDNEAYPDYMCRDKPWPGNNRTCGLQPCPQTKRWKTGDWSQCSATCGGGVQSRSVYCASHNGHHFQDAVDDTECASLTGKPRSTQPCNLQRCATWVSGPWSECSVSCGEGIQTRTVSCQVEQGPQILDIACLREPKPQRTQPCIGENCIQEIGWHIGDWGLCSKSCSSGIRTRQVICADGDSKFYSYEICQEIQPQTPTTLGSCNTQPCHLPQQVPSMQDITGFNISRRTLLTRYRPDQGTEVSRHERIIQSGSTHRQAQLNESPHSNFLPLGWDSYSDSSVSRRSHSYPNGGSNVQDCNHTPHGCCSDGHTAATGAFGQGCPLDSCHLSRYGCCPDGISRSQGPNQEGCKQYYSDVYISRNHPITPTPTTSQVLAQQVPTEECRGSMYGCCYDNIASALGPQGEGCPTRLSQSYAVQCLLPSAHGSCTDWTIRWYFVSDVGKCNRFWYGSCHGNKNNFATEEECMKICHGSVGRSYVSLHPHVASPNIHSSSQLQEGNTEVKPQQFGRTITHRTGNEGHGDRTSSNQDALPESEQRASLLENQPESSRHSRRLDEIKRDTVDHLHGLGESVISRHSEKQLTVNGQTTQHEREEWTRESGVDGLTWRRFGHQTPPDSTFPHSLNRIFLDGPESSPVEAGLGHSIRLLCKTDNSHFSRVEWHKDGQQISSDRHTYQSDNSLVVSHLRSEDAGIYMCIISNGRVEHRQIELLVKEIPQSTVTQGRRHQLTHGQNQQPRVLGTGTNDRWSHVSSLHPQITYRGTIESILSCGITVWFGSITASDRKAMQRVVRMAEKIIGSSLPSIQDTAYKRCLTGIRRRMLKMYKNEPSVVDASIGEEVRLPCRVEASPSLTIEWQKDGRPVSSARHRQQPNGALLISHLTAEDAGFFTCIASNGRDQDQKKVQIRPRGDLRIIDLLPRLSVSEGENAHLHCVATGNNVNIRWSRNGVPVRSDGHRIQVSQDGSLFLNNVQLGDEGSYTCNAYSGNHSVSASTDVKVIKRRPEVPASLPVDTSRECADQPHLANCDLILQAQLCNNEYYSSFCCASCSRRYG